MRKLEILYRVLVCIFVFAVVVGVGLRIIAFKTEKKGRLKVPAKIEVKSKQVSVLSSKTVVSDLVIKKAVVSSVAFDSTVKKMPVVSLKNKDSIKIFKLQRQIDSLRQLSFNSIKIPKRVNMTIAQRKGLFYARYGWFIELICHELNVSQDTLISLMTHESGADPIVVNNDYGATGCGQWLESSAKVKGPEYGISIDNLDRRNPYVNIWMTAKYLAENRDKYAGNTDKGVVAHWIGPNGVNEQIRIFGSVKKIPFLQYVGGIVKVKPTDPPPQAVERLQKIEQAICGDLDY